MFNQKYWRSHDYRVKWRPVFYDLDFGLSGSQNLLYDYFNPVGVPSANGSFDGHEIIRRVGKRMRSGGSFL